MKTLILLRGGHTTVVKDTKPSNIEHLISEYRESTDGCREGSGLLYIDSPSHGTNGLCIDPRAVVALVAT